MAPECRSRCRRLSDAADVIASFGGMAGAAEPLPIGDFVGAAKLDGENMIGLTFSDLQPDPALLTGSIGPPSDLATLLPCEDVCSHNNGGG